VAMVALLVTALRMVVMATMVAMVEMPFTLGRPLMLTLP
jgi:hypothetical protein